MDLKEHLSGIISDISKNTENTKNPENKKSLNTSHFTSRMEEFMDNTVINKYARNWSKLENKLKTQKIQEYVDEISETYQFDDKNNDTLFKHIISRMRQNRLNKMSEITYCKEKCCILEIKKLKLNNNMFEFTD